MVGDILALMGDTADNIPVCRGLGKPRPSSSSSTAIWMGCTKRCLAQRQKDASDR